MENNTSEAHYFGVRDSTKEEWPMCHTDFKMEFIPVLKHINGNKYSVEQLRELRKRLEQATTDIINFVIREWTPDTSQAEKDRYTEEEIKEILR